MAHMHVIGMEAVRAVRERNNAVGETNNYV